MFIDFEMIDSFSFGLGFIYFMICEVIFAFINFLTQKAFELRDRRRYMKESFMSPDGFKDFLKVYELYRTIKEQR